MNTKKDKIKVRRTWDINPETQVRDSLKKYERSQSKQELYKTIQDLEQGEEDDYDME